MNIIIHFLLKQFQAKYLAHPVGSHEAKIFFHHDLLRSFKIKIKIEDKQEGRGLKMEGMEGMKLYKVCELVWIKLDSETFELLLFPCLVY